MRKLELEQEKNAIDIITNSMFSLCFLESISDFIFSPKRDALTVGQFYDKWMKGTHANELKIPYNLGAILGYLYCGILFAKEHWYDLLPDVDLARADPEWGISRTACISPKKNNPSLKYAIRRIRNALGHGHVIVRVPDNINRTEFMTRVALNLNDENMSDASDTFNITLNIGQLYEFIKKYQSVIHPHVRYKK